MADGLTCWLLDAAAAEALGDVWEDGDEAEGDGETDDGAAAPPR